MYSRKKAFVDWGSFAEKASETEWVESIILEEPEEMTLQVDKAVPQAKNKEDSTSIVEESMHFTGAEAHSEDTFITEVAAEEKQPVKADRNEGTVISLEVHELSQPEAALAASASCSKESAKEMEPRYVSKLDCYICGLPYTHCSNVCIHYMAMQLLRCPKCPRIRFHLREEHRNHLRTHMGLRPYGCHICGKQFTRIDNRNSHLYMHSTNWPYICTVCGENFRLKQALLKHIELKNHPNKVIKRHKPNLNDDHEQESANTFMLRSIKAKMLKDVILKLWEDLTMVPHI